MPRLRASTLLLFFTTLTQVAAPDPVDLRLEDCNTANKPGQLLVWVDLDSDPSAPADALNTNTESGAATWGKIQLLPLSQSNCLSRSGAGNFDITTVKCSEDTAGWYARMPQPAGSGTYAILAYKSWRRRRVRRLLLGEQLEECLEGVNWVSASPFNCNAAQSQTWQFTASGGIAMMQGGFSK